MSRPTPVSPPADARADNESFPPGSVVVIRDEDWIVQRAERATDGWFVDVAGLSELVRGTEATFSTALDKIESLDPSKARVKVDESPRYGTSRLWLEATRRKTAVPLLDPTLTVATEGLVDPLPYQLAAVRQVLDRENLRPRILLADAVGLGKTIEIGMILSELVRRGRGERILIVTPRHVLEQMQFEMWTRFALPFVRLDSVGIQRIRQQLPATRNPFAYFKQVIISIDTLKSDRYHAHLEKQRWDAVVIDESHNVTNSGTQNNRLARLLSTQTDALILASATPHNGKKESFAELIRMLEPTAVTPDGELIEDEVRRLIIRRHRHSPEVADYVGGDWAERLEPNNVHVPANPVEREIAEELDRTWLRPASGSEVVPSKNQLLPWTFAKAYLSSAAALKASLTERLKRSSAPPEIDALNRLLALTERNLDEGSAKFDALLKELRRIGIKRNSEERVVVFAERVPTLNWLRTEIQAALKLKPDQVTVLHGGLTDVEQQEIVESFKQQSSPIRVLVTGDVASEGVNLHLQCHELIHYDIPWSLIRIEQRNGRIDRYGQQHSPRITALLLDPGAGGFGGDLRVLQRLMEKEYEAHRVLGDSASLMGKYDEKAEEEEIRRVLAGQAEVDDVIRDVDEVASGGGISGLLATLLEPRSSTAPEAAPAQAPPKPPTDSVLFSSPEAFLHDALEVAFTTPRASVAAGGVAWEQHDQHAIVEFTPSVDLQQRLRVLPQSYLRERRVVERLKLATDRRRGDLALSDARELESTSLWPEAHYLAPLHPALDWAADRALAALARNEVFAIAAPTADPGAGPSVVLQASLSNARGQIVAASAVLVRFPDTSNPTFALPQPLDSVEHALELLGLTDAWINTQALTAADEPRLQPFIAPAVQAADTVLDQTFASAAADVTTRVARWIERVENWEQGADHLFRSTEMRSRRQLVVGERGLAQAMQPDQRLIRPLLVVAPITESAR